MKKPVSIPPNYFYGCLILCAPFYFIMKSFRLIAFPFNLFGLLLIPVGLYLVINPWYLFKKHNTPEDFSVPTAIVKEKIYRYSRNPMYLGGVLILAGTAISTGNPLSFILPLVFCLIMHFMFIPYEEDMMYKKFGEDYANYKKTTRKWL
ncbi:MAG: isoprenylcysteine carboxylmethyltransferase family protein [Bacteroidales bacterium]|nr:isoprenylcysteine carboxylmethyltransferase family protein [Bacteroidales bacterium]